MKVQFADLATSSDGDLMLTIRGKVSTVTEAAQILASFAGDAPHVPEKEPEKSAPAAPPAAVRTRQPRAAPAVVAENVKVTEEVPAKEPEPAKPAPAAVKQPAAKPTNGTDYAPYIAKLKDASGFRVVMDYILDQGITDAVKIVEICKAIEDHVPVVKRISEAGDIGDRVARSLDQLLQIRANAARA